MTKRGAIVAAAGFLIVLLIGGFCVYLVRHALQAAGKMAKVPDDLKIARVVSGEDLFSRTVYYTEPELGVITEIKQDLNYGLVVVGRRGAAFLSENHLPARKVHFERCDSDVVWSGLWDGAFLCRGGWSMGTALFNSGGKTQWTYGGGMMGVDDAAAGNLGVDGRRGVVVGLNGNGGVRFLSSEGKELWKQKDENVWHVEIAADERSANVILHSNGYGQLTVRSAAGDVLARYTPEIDLFHFSLTAWTDDPHLNKLIAADQGSVYLLTMEGKTVARLPAPGATRYGEAKGTPVHFSEGTPYYASLVRHEPWARSILYIYDERNRLVYDEILDHDCAALYAAPGQNDTQDLLLGCDDNVWKYSLKK
jgi:hypothetical protein